MKVLFKVVKSIGCFMAYIVCVVGAACWMNLLTGIWTDDEE